MFDSSLLLEVMDPGLFLEMLVRLSQGTPAGTNESMASALVNVSRALAGNVDPYILLEIMGPGLLLELLSPEVVL